LRQTWSALVFWFAGLVLRPFIHMMRYRTAPAEPGTALELDPRRAICYVLPEHSWIDLLALDRICAGLGLPRPTSSTRSLPTPERPACVYLPALLETRLRRTDLSALLERALTTPDYDVQVVPVSIFWGRDPGQETSLLRLLFADIPQAGSVRKFLMMLVNGHNVLANFGKPLLFRAYVSSADDAGRAQRKLARALRIHFLHARTAALGPSLLSRRVVIDTALNSPGVRQAVEREMRDKNMSMAKAQARARRCADEIAADYSSSILNLTERALTLVWHRVFSGVETYGLDRVRDLAQSHEVIYLPAHRSHADYLLISYVLYHAGLVPPHIAAGVNLNFWPVGGLLRRCGAFYMRRSFSGDKVYTAVFRAYVDGLIRRGYSISFYPEGTRSRTGRLLAPKTGLLSMVLDSALRNRGRPVALVPIFIGYDKVWELNSYFKELRGGAKERESAEALLKATRILGQSHGKAYVSFGEPLLLQKDADAKLPGWREQFLPDGDARPEGFPAYVRDLAREHMRRINNVAVANPVGLAACALLSAPARAAGEDELREQLALLVALLQVWPGPPVTVPMTASQAIIDWAAPIARVKRVPHAWGDLLIADGRDAILLTYMRNNIQHLFAVPSLIARLFRTRGALGEEAVLTACRALYPFLRNEFFLPWPATEIENVAAIFVARMVELGLLTRDDSGHLRRPEVSSRAFAGLAGLGRILGETLERYAIALLLLADEAAQGQEQGFTRERFVNDCRLLAERMAMLTGREAPEFFDRALFSGYLDSLVEVGVVQQSAGGGLVLDARINRIADRSLELLSDETRQTLMQLLARRRAGETSSI
jgi:glycerol-3-phosphate O-acyltransferase